MKILYLIPRFPVPSETFISQEVIGLLAYGIQIIPVALGAPVESEFKKLSPEFQMLVGRTTYLPYWAALRLGLSGLSGMPGILSQAQALVGASRLNGRVLAVLLRASAVARIVRKEGCSQLHAHWPASVKIGAVVHYLTGLPYSISVHAHEVAHDNKHFPLVFKSCSFATFCNLAAMNYLLEQMHGEPRNLCHLVYHGVDLTMFPEIPVPSVRCGISIVSAGRLTPTKGFDRLIEGLKAAIDAGLNARLTIIGDGPERERLKKLSHTLGVAGRITFRGWLPYSEVHKELGEAHVFALLASANYHDGLPNVVLEAMAVGRPVILSPLPAAREAVDTGRNGFILSRPDAYGELVDCLRVCSDNQDAVARMGREARAYIVSNHDKRVHLGRLAALFTQKVRKTS